jgi:hypothetical protein
MVHKHPHCGDLVVPNQMPAAEMNVQSFKQADEQDHKDVLIFIFVVQ